MNKCIGYLLFVVAILFVVLCGYGIVVDVEEGLRNIIFYIPLSIFFIFIAIMLINSED